MAEQAREIRDYQELDIPAKCLPLSIREHLANSLDLDYTAAKNWRNLAEKLGYDNQETRIIEHKTSRGGKQASETLLLLEDYEAKPDATVAKIVQALDDIRWDRLSNDIVNSKQVLLKKNADYETYIQQIYRPPNLNPQPPIGLNPYPPNPPLPGGFPLRQNQQHPGAQNNLSPDAYNDSYGNASGGFNAQSTSDTNRYESLHPDLRGNDGRYLVIPPSDGNAGRNSENQQVLVTQNIQNPNPGIYDENPTSQPNVLQYDYEHYETINESNENPPPVPIRLPAVPGNISTNTPQPSRNPRLPPTPPQHQSQSSAESYSSSYTYMNIYEQALPNRSEYAPNNLGSMTRHEQESPTRNEYLISPTGNEYTSQSHDSVQRSSLGYVGEGSAIPPSIHTSLKPNNRVNPQTFPTNPTSNVPLISQNQNISQAQHGHSLSNIYSLPKDTQFSQTAGTYSTTQNVLSNVPNNNRNTPSMVLNIPPIPENPPSNSRNSQVNLSDVNKIDTQNKLQNTDLKNIDPYNRTNISSQITTECSSARFTKTNQNSTTKSNMADGSLIPTSLTKPLNILATSQNPGQKFPYTQGNLNTNIAGYGIQRPDIQHDNIADEISMEFSSSDLPFITNATCSPSVLERHLPKPQDAKNWSNEKPANIDEVLLRQKNESFPSDYRGNPSLQQKTTTKSSKNLPRYSSSSSLSTDEERMSSEDDNNQPASQSILSSEQPNSKMLSGIGDNVSQVKRKENLVTKETVPDMLGGDQFMEAETDGRATCTDRNQQTNPTATVLTSQHQAMDEGTEETFILRSNQPSTLEDTGVQHTDMYPESRDVSYAHAPANIPTKRKTPSSDRTSTCSNESSKSPDVLPDNATEFNSNAQQSHGIQSTGAIQSQRKTLNLETKNKNLTPSPLPSPGTQILSISGTLSLNSMSAEGLSNLIPPKDSMSFDSLRQDSCLGLAEGVMTSVDVHRVEDNVKVPEPDYPGHFEIFDVSPASRPMQESRKSKVSPKQIPTGYNQSTGAGASHYSTQMFKDGNVAIKCDTVPKHDDSIVVYHHKHSESPIVKDAAAKIEELQITPKPKEKTKKKTKKCKHKHDRAGAASGYQSTDVENVEMQERFNTHKSYLESTTTSTQTNIPQNQPSNISQDFTSTTHSGIPSSSPVIIQHCNIQNVSFTQAPQEQAQLSNQGVTYSNVESQTMNPNYFQSQGTPQYRQASNNTTTQTQNIGPKKPQTHTYGFEYSQEPTTYTNMAPNINQNTSHSIHTSPLLRTFNMAANMAADENLNRSNTMSSATPQPDREKPPHQRSNSDSMTSCSTASSGASQGQEDLAKKSKSDQVVGHTEFKKGPRGIRVFLTYSKDSKKHLQRVLTLFKCLTTNGFSCSMDMKDDKYLLPDSFSSGDGFNVSPREDWFKKRYYSADFVVICITKRYNLKISESTDEFGSLSTDELHTKYIYTRMKEEFEQANFRNIRFIPVIFSGASEADVPHWLQEKSRIYKWPDGFKDLFWIMIRLKKKRLEYASERSQSSTSSNELTR